MSREDLVFHAGPRYMLSEHVCAVNVCAVHVCAVHVCAVHVCAVHVCAVHVCAVHVCVVHVCASHKCVIVFREDITYIHKEQTAVQDRSMIMFISRDVNLSQEWHTQLCFPSQKILSCTVSLSLNIKHEASHCHRHLCSCRHRCPSLHRGGEKK